MSVFGRRFAIRFVALVALPYSLEKHPAKKDWSQTTYFFEIENMIKRGAPPKEVISLYDEYVHTYNRSDINTVNYLLKALSKDRNFESQSLEMLKIHRANGPHNDDWAESFLLNARTSGSVDLITELCRWMPWESILKSLREEDNGERKLTGREIILKKRVLCDTYGFVRGLQYAADRMDEETFDYILKGAKGKKEFLDYAQSHRMRDDKHNGLFVAKVLWAVAAEKLQAE